MTNAIATKLREAASDPMWADHIEHVSKRLLTNAADEIDHLEAEAKLTPDSISSAGAILQHVCYDAAKKSGWWLDTETGEDVRTWPDKFFKLWVAAKLALVHSEVSEGLEGHRKGLMDDHLPTRRMLEVELADAVIRICDLAGGLAMDLGGAIAEKLQYNSTRKDHKLENRIADGGKSI
jgi:NTP pyrophosphatase (non-canonical NTP hydrolase)